MISHRWWAVATGLLAFIVYFFTLAPDVMFTDSGELAGACATLGVAHPTGYPLFVILGHVWTLLPLPMSIIAKLNLFAAACTAASVSVFFLFCRLILQWFATPEQKSGIQQTKGKKKTETAVQSTSTEQVSSLNDMAVNIIAASSALLFAFARTVWAQATSIEVYSLHLLLMMLTLYFCVGGILTRNTRMQFVGAFAFGLGFTNHLTTILLIIPIAVLFFYRPGERLTFSAERRKEFFVMLGILVSCAAVYGVMLLRSSGGAWFN
ncbi:MAG: DUF2723 domain-containing protein, partial [Candidatus Kapabacteria bacterium]|nr:DUF2723 domain-containing protein [Candidatus Kapabacteria bacterium]